jgi:PD-(D/E)XK nuclease superfamily
VTTSAPPAGLSQEELARILRSIKRVCLACQRPLDAAFIGDGIHPACDEPPPNRDDEPPPPTLPVLTEALARLDANRPRSLQTSIGPSELATPCPRRLAYGLAHLPRSTRTAHVAWAAWIGTAMHAMIAEALRGHNERLGRERWLIEEEVRPDPAIYGSCDAFDCDTDTVIDWKLVGASSLTRYATKGPGEQYRGQIQLYGRGWQQAGRRPKWVRIVFLPRASHRITDTYEWTEPYDWRRAEETLDRMYQLAQHVNSPDFNVQSRAWDDIEARPGRDCNYCPFHRPGPPADHTGCPGDVEAEERRLAKFSEGIIAPD